MRNRGETEGLGSAAGGRGHALPPGLGKPEPEWTLLCRINQ